MSQAILGILRGAVEEEETDMGDIEYLARIANGELTSGELVSLKLSFNTGTNILGTVPGGKDWYLAKWNMKRTGSTSGFYNLEYPTGTSIESIETGASGTINHDGVNVGLKLVAGQTISVVLAGTASASDTNMEIIQVDTGVSPKLT